MLFLSSWAKCIFKTVYFQKSVITCKYHTIGANIMIWVTGQSNKPLELPCSCKLNFPVLKFMVNLFW